MQGTNPTEQSVCPLRGRVLILSDQYSNIYREIDY
jgi:hypothetical protein